MSNARQISSGIKTIAEMAMNFITMSEPSLRSVYTNSKEVLSLLQCKSGYLVIFKHLSLGVFTAQSNIDECFYLANLASNQWKEQTLIWDTNKEIFCEKQHCNTETQGVTLIVCNHPCSLQSEKSYPRSLSIVFKNPEDTLIFFQC